jgi:mono/diheme cytochrome c family protein
MFPRPLNSFPTLAAWVSIMAAATLPAAAAGNATSGQQIAERWCASCHLVTLEQKGASADAPTFFEIAKRSTGDMTGLQAFLADPHPPMPDMNLTRNEIDDLLAYIGSLK